VNNDGNPDVIVGSPLNSDNGANAGLARVWFTGAKSAVDLLHREDELERLHSVDRLQRRAAACHGSGRLHDQCDPRAHQQERPALLEHGEHRVPFEGGTLCVKSPVIRTTVQNSGCATCGACQGAYSYLFSQSYMAAHSLHAGDTLYRAVLSRDPGFAPPNNVGLSDALKFTLVK